MVSKRRHGLPLLALSYFPTKLPVKVMGLGSQALTLAQDKSGKGGENNLTGMVLKTLFVGVWCSPFACPPELRKNIEGFEAEYVFETRDGAVEESAIFNEG